MVGEGLGGGVEGLAGGEEVVEVDMVARRVRRAGMERARRAVVGREGRRRGIIWRISWGEEGGGRGKWRREMCVQ